LFVFLASLILTKYLDAKRKGNNLLMESFFFLKLREGRGEKKRVCNCDANWATLPLQKRHLMYIIYSSSSIGRVVVLGGIEVCGIFAFIIS